MTGAKFAEYIRFLTQTNSTVLPDSDIVTLSNIVKDDFAKEIVKADEDLFGLIQTRNLVASSTSREYSIPTTTMKIKRAEAMFDGTNYVNLIERDMTQWRQAIGSESQIVAQFTNDEGDAFFEIFRNSLWIYSGTISAVTSGLKLWTIEWPADIDTTDLADTTNDLSADPSTTTSSIPRQFHELWARKVSIIWKSSRQRPITLNQSEQKFDIDFNSAMESIKSFDLDRETLGSIPYNDGAQY